jgi:hypothetical protein
MARVQPSRRAVLAGLAASAAAPALGWASAGNPAFLACAKDPTGAVALHGLDRSGASLFSRPLPARGHAGARHPQRAEAVVFARRPGAYALVLDAVSGSLAATLAPPSGLHFNGHGTFLQGGALLVTSEQVAETSEGRLGLWAADQGYRRIGDLPSGGIGPHEVLALPDGGLAIANGGIATMAGTREETGTEDMRPNLAFADAEGRLTDVLEPQEAHRMASIRHLAALPGGGVAAALQWHGQVLGLGPSAPLLAIGKAGGGLRPSAAPQALWDAALGYAGSIAATSDGLIALTAPRGNRLFLFDAQGRHVATLASADVCGIAASGEGFIASTGEGALLHVTRIGLAFASTASIAWDNHIVALA